jgi:hypothetical protein
MSGRENSDYKVIAGAYAQWWRELQSLNRAGKPMVLKGGGEKAPDRAALAQLRRIDILDLGGVPIVDVAGVLEISAFRVLMARLAELPIRNGLVRRWLVSQGQEWEPFAIAAATLAYVREDTGRNGRGATAKLLGQPRGEDDGRLFAEARFKRLIRTRNDWPGLFMQAKRIAAILSEKAPVGDLGASLILWNADPLITRDWAFQYYQRDFSPTESETEPAVS